jgi:hypothetical protein
MPNQTLDWLDALFDSPPLQWEHQQLDVPTCA